MVIWNKLKIYARELKEDEEFYKECSKISREYYNNSLYNEKNFVPYITRIFEDLYEENKFYTTK